MAEYYDANGIVRLSGSWSQTAALMFDSEFKLHPEKLSIEPITAGMPAAEAAHMIGYAGGDGSHDIPKVLTRFIAEQVLQATTPIAATAGYIMQDCSSGQDNLPKKQVALGLMTRDDALQQKLACPDW